MQAALKESQPQHFLHNGPINRVNEILQSKRIESIRPSDEQLEQMEIYTIHKWNKIVEKKTDPSMRQAWHIARFLDVAVEKLFPEE